MPELTQEQIEQFQKDLRILKFQMQENQDSLSGGLTSRNLKSFRNTYVINSQDSLDADYPMYVHFNIISEMIKIVSVKVDFWILKFRAYSKTAAAGGAQTSSSTTTPSGGGATSGVTGGSILTANNSDHSVSNTVASGTTVYGIFIPAGGMAVTDKTSLGAKDVYPVSHKHYLGDHTHTTPNHTHPTHAHTVADHTHTAVYGIFEEDTSPTIKFYVSENAGVSYSDVFGGYTTNKSALDITSLITTKGNKLIKFTSDVRARLSIQVEIKLDISARS